jgi:hypothetical protein
MQSLRTRSIRLKCLCSMLPAPRNRTGWCDSSTRGVPIAIALTPRRLHRVDSPFGKNAESVDSDSWSYHCIHQPVSSMHGAWWHDSYLGSGISIHIHLDPLRRWRS